MTFARLYEFACGLGGYPIKLEGVLDQKAMELSAQDELYYVEADLDPDISLGHIKQYRVPQGVYADPRWVTEIRYHRDLNVCWQRYVCCKELMHVFDSADERTDTSEKFTQLINEIEAPLPFDKSSPMFQTETRTMWMALAVLCPEPLHDHFLPFRQSKEKSDYEIALELRIPEALIRAAFSENYKDVVASLL